MLVSSPSSANNRGSTDEEFCHKRPACMLLFAFFEGGAFLFTATPRTRKEFLPRQSLLWLRGRTVSALRAERHTLTSAERTSCSACHELLCSRAFLFIVLRSARHPQVSRFLQIFQIPRKICKKRGICGCCALRRTIKRKAREQRSS